MKLPILIYLVSASLSGCTHGKLGSKIREIRLSHKLETCEKQDFDKKIELVDLIDSLADKIGILKPLERNFRRQKFGELTLRIPIIDKNSNNPDNWTSFDRGWKNSFKKFESYKRSPDLANLKKLSDSVRSIVMDDSRRILGSSNYSIHHDSYPLLIEIFDELEKCSNSTNCQSVKVSKKADKFLLSNFDLAWFWKRIRKGNFGSSNRHIETLLKWVVLSKGRFEFRKMEHFYLDKESGKLTVFMDSGVIEGSENEIARLIETRWSTPKLPLTVCWVKQKNCPQAYRIVKKLAGRSVVSHKRRKMIMSEDSKLRSFFHEFGHVLGFPDRYYTVWNSKDCGYKFETNNSDIMSSASLGSVTDKHSQELIEVYGSKIKPTSCSCDDLVN